MERRAAEIKVFWSNLYRGVRTIYVSYVKPKESISAYRFLLSLSKRRGDLSELRDMESKLLLKITTRKRIKENEAAFFLLPSALNILSKAVTKNPKIGIFSLVSFGFKKPRLVSYALTVNKDVHPELIRPLGIILYPHVSVNILKRRSKHVLYSLWNDVRSELSLLGMRYIDFEKVALAPPIAIVPIYLSSGGREEIKAVVSDGGEYREVKIPVRTPTWRIDDLPPKIIEEIKVSIVNPVKNKMPFATKGAFLTGPPGVGKSVMAEALADALGLKVVELRPQSYRSMWYGSTEKMLNAIFKQIIRRRRSIALIIDDAEFISSRKFTMHEAHISEISTILYHLQRPDRPFTVLTANNPELIDPAILRPGRIDVTVVIGYPDRSMRRKALLRNAERYSIKIKGNSVIEKIVSLSKWFTLAEVDAFLRLAAGKGNGVVGMDEVEWARKKFNIDHSERISAQDYLRWWARKTQGIVISYIPRENEM